MKSFSYCQRYESVCVYEHFHFTTTISHSLTFTLSFLSFPFGLFNFCFWWRWWWLVVDGVYLCSPVTIKHLHTLIQKMTLTSECKTKLAVVFRAVQCTPIQIRTTTTTLFLFYLQFQWMLTSLVFGSFVQFCRSFHFVFLYSSLLWFHYSSSLFRLRL